MKFVMPLNWETNGDGTRGAPAIYMGKVHENNQYTPEEQPSNAEYAWHDYLLLCVRYLDYQGCTFTPEGFWLPSPTPYVGVRPYNRFYKSFKPSQWTVMELPERWEAFSPDQVHEYLSGTTLGPGYLYSRSKIWRTYSSSPVPSLQRTDAEGLLDDDFKLQHLGTTSWWWSPPSSLISSLHSEWLAAYPGLLSPGEQFRLVLYCECWAGRIFYTVEEADESISEHVLKSTNPEEVDIWATAFFM